MAFEEFGFEFGVKLNGDLLDTKWDQKSVNINEKDKEKDCDQVGNSQHV